MSKVLHAAARGCALQFTDAFYLQVYNIALLVEAQPAEAALQQTQLPDPTPNSVCAALAQGQFRKVLQIHMLRDITSTQFKDGLRENLVPNVKQYGGEECLESFMNFFDDKGFGKGSVIPLLWSSKGPPARLCVNLHASHFSAIICFVLPVYSSMSSVDCWAYVHSLLHRHKLSCAFVY